MSNKNKDVGFSFDSADLEKTKYFNLDGSNATHVDVWVEAYDDKRFWLAHLPTSSKYKFFTKIPDQITAPDGKISTGCDRLFKMEEDGVITLGKAQLFCLDSDDSFLKYFIPGFSSFKKERDFVYLTKVYAIDNIFLESSSLDRTFETVTGTSISSLATKPSGLLSAISGLVFDVVLGLAFYDVVLYCGKVRHEFKARFKRLLESIVKLDCRQVMMSCSKFSRLESSFQKLKKRIESLIVSSGKKKEYDEFRGSVSRSGVVSENAYLFVKGHYIYDGLVGSLEKLSDSLREAEIARVELLYADHEFRVRAINKQWPNFGHSLKSAYYASLPAVPFFDTSLSRLAADYA